MMRGCKMIRVVNYFSEETLRTNIHWSYVLFPIRKYEVSIL